MPSSLNGTGVTFNDGSTLQSGNIPAANLGSGTADSTTFLRGDRTWGQAPRAFMSEAQTVTANYTVTAADDMKVFVVTNSAAAITLPAVASVRQGFTIGIENRSGQLITVLTSSGQIIRTFPGGARIAGANIVLITRVDDQWSDVLLRTSAPFNVVQFTDSATYTPPVNVQAVLFCVVGSRFTAPTRTGSPRVGGRGGPGYSEKYVVAPSGTYTFTSGAGNTDTSNVTATTGTTTLTGTGVSISIPGVSANTTTTGTAGSAGSGGDFNATGGTGGNGSTASSSGRSGGNGGAGTRAGNGGDGGLGVAAANHGAGGGTGGNNASGNVPGIAATTQASGVFSLTSLATNVSFDAGNAPANTGYSPDGGGGAGALTVFSGGWPGEFRLFPNHNSVSDFNPSNVLGLMTVLEFYL